MGQSVRVDGGNQAILVADIGGKLGILGVLATSTCLLATTLVVATLSLGEHLPCAQDSAEGAQGNLQKLAE